MRFNIRNKEGALELSVGTIVILVIGMTMLILVIVLVRTIFTGATESVDTINENVRAEINKLFSDSTKRLVVNLPDNQIKIQKGESFGIAIGIRNTKTGTSSSETFTYRVAASEVETGCQGLDITRATNYLSLGRAGSVTLTPGGDPETLLIKISPSDEAPLCEVSYKIEVFDASNQIYDTEFFIVEIVGR